jgi:putative ATP-dependent endonuclease of OLD family
LNFFHALRVQAKENEEIRTFEELGSGEQQILAISFAHAYAKAFRAGFVLAIEEPEAHLHPLAQKWLSERIDGMCRDGLQIILSTHSPAFMNILNLSGMYLVHKESSVTHTTHHTEETLARYCIERDANQEKCKPTTILAFYAANTTDEIMEGFFARAVVLVEGQTEALALPIYLAACGCDTRKLGIAVLPVHGKGSISRYVRLFEAFGIPVFVIFDNDPEEDESADKRKEIIATVGEKIDDNLLESGKIYIGTKIAIFGIDFEQSLRELFDALGYESIEMQVQQEFGPAKPVVAREVAKRLAAQEISHEFWNPLKDLAAAIGKLLTKREIDESKLEDTIRVLFGEEPEERESE